MILLTLSFLQEHLFPPRKKLDRIDRGLLWVIKVCLLVLFLTLPPVVLSDEDKVNPGFFFSCSGGDIEGISDFLEYHPTWVNSRTENGESCLHLAGIYGHSDVTEYMLKRGADPNIRSTYEQGLRMHPLSWNVYGGHVDNVALLLKYGADVNLDFDGMDASNAPVTVLDVVTELTKTEAGDASFVKIESILRQYGAKTMQELSSTRENEL